MNPTPVNVKPALCLVVLAAALLGVPGATGEDKPVRIALLRDGGSARVVTNWPP